jgi:hypothetical protein
MKYKSEAQAFQAIRKYMKEKRNSSQRYQNEYVWTIKNSGKRHPTLFKLVSKYDKTANLPLLPIDIAEHQAEKYQNMVSECQLFLNRFRT